MRNPTAYSFCNILNTHFGKGYCKDSSYTFNIIEKLEGAKRTDRNAMGFAAKPIRKAGETYWMHELQKFFQYGLNDRIGDEFKNDNKLINLLLNFHVCHENIVVLIVVKISKVFAVFYYNNF